jgi:excinuclease ABC subunit B
VFQLETSYKPKGDQPTAIEKLSQGIIEGKNAQVLLGITGSGKTFTIANVIEKVQKKTLIIAHNKTLAAQLYQEFKGFFPHNAVEYFVSYYDYYQPEAYIPRTDSYIEKDMAINDHIDKLRHSATRSLLERDDVIIVASVSCIYGLGTPEYYKEMNLTLEVGGKYPRDDLLLHLVEMSYKRNDYDFSRGNFRIRGDTLEIFPAYEEKRALRIEFFDEEIERISEIDPLTGKTYQQVNTMTLYPGSHHVTPEYVRFSALQTIREELNERLLFYDTKKLPLESERIQQRTMYDLEMIREVGACKGIENYSRHFSKRAPGEPPPCLMDYFPKDFLLVIDESHQTIPQMRGMYHGDRSRKQTLIDFGFRLPSAFDNRPLRFEESYQYFNNVIYVSATPTEWEIEEAHGDVIKQIIRPTGLLDPQVEVRPAKNQVDDCLEEIRQHSERGGRVLVTTLTKRLAEELTTYLKEINVKARYLHSDIVTLERVQIIEDLRRGVFDVLVGINLLREGLDIPEVSLVAILDADKEGFLRSHTALIQTCGRAARNVEGRVIMYADKMTDSIQKTVDITLSRRKLQEEYNKEHSITPTSTKRELGLSLEAKKASNNSDQKSLIEEPTPLEAEHEYLTPNEVSKRIEGYETAMKKAAKEFRFEDAARFRDLMRKYQDIEVTMC